MHQSFQRRKDDRLPARILAFFKRFFMVIGIACFISFVFFLATLNKLVNYTPPSLPDRMLLTYTFESGLGEVVTKPSFNQPLLRPATTFHEIVMDIRKAARDDKVKGFVARIKDMNLEPAQIQELRRAIAEFRAAGKFAYVFSDDIGGFSSGMGDYYLAGAFDQIWLQPVGAVSINGLAIEVPFLKGVMDKVGVAAEFSHQGIYKSAPESLTMTGMSAPHREMMSSIVADLADQMAVDLAADRKMTVEAFRAIIDKGPYTDQEALDLKLVDKLDYYGEMMATAKRKAGGLDDKEVVPLGRYSFLADTIELNQGVSGFVSKFLRKSDPVTVTKDKAKIALVFGSGTIVPYTSKSKAGFGEGGMSADKIVAAFSDVQKDEDVVAVVFRVDSPGGSPVAAESIRRAIIETQKKGKKVIVSMGAYAASGGYWIATPADKIVAEAATLTGSIGVFGGKFVFADLWEKLGLRWESITAGDHAEMWSSNKGFSAPERARFEAMMKNIYDGFIARVMEGRKMTREEALAVAEGRVWTGRQAKEKRLVDELGGLDRAIAIAKEASGIPQDQLLPIERFPKQKSTLELFLSLATEGAVAAPKLNVRDLLTAVQAAMVEESLSVPRIEWR